VRIRAFGIYIALLLTASFCNVTEALADSQHRQKVGLVLAGGGARGIAHIGVIRYLEEQGIKIDAVAGTSMGSIIAALYASGLNADQMEEVALNLDWAKAFNDKTPRDQLPYREKEQDFEFLIGAKLRYKDGTFNLPAGLIEGQNLNFILHDIVSHVSHIRDFDQLPIPYRAVAADVVTGDPVVLAKGDLAVAMRASMSLPGIYSPVELDGKLLVDGGIANNLPVDVVKAMGVDRVIVVDISTPLAKREQLTDVLSLMGQLTSILTRKNTELQLSLLDEQDLLIVPPLDDYGIGSASFELAETSIKVGYETAAKMENQLTAFRPAPGLADIHIASANLNVADPVITDIQIDNNSGVPDALIGNLISQQVGQPLNRTKLEHDLASVWGIDQFSRVDYYVSETVPGEGVLHVSTQTNERGISYLRLGLNLDQDSKGDSEFGLRASWRQRGLNQLGGEWFTVAQLGGNSFLRTEFYQPIDEQQRFFVLGRYELDNSSINVAEDGDIFAKTELQKHRIDVQAGINVSNFAQFQFGVFGESAHNDVTIGDPRFSSEHYNGTGYTAAFNVDTLDATIFPRSGFRGGVRYDKTMEAWGSDNNYEAFSAVAIGATSWGKNSLLATMAWSAFDTSQNFEEISLPVSSRALGGLFNLSGYTSNSLVGPYTALGTLIYYRRLDEQGVLPVDLPVYLGGSLEAGNTWLKKNNADFDELIYAGSLFLGVDTPLGPLYIGAGLAENDQKAVYIKLGQVLD